MERADSLEVVRLPMACTLGPDDGAARIRRWEALSATWRLSARRRGHLLEVRYKPEPGVRGELQALAAAERRCCSLADWKVTREQDHVVLHVQVDPAHPHDVAALADLFGAD